MERRTLFLTIALSVLAALTACDAGAPAPTATPTTVAQVGNKPTFTIISPADGALVPQGSTLSIRSSAADTRGVTKIELWVDGVLYRVDMTREADGLPSVTVTQTWPATDLGGHVMLLKAINRDGVASDSQTLNISVVPQGAVTPAATRAPSGTVAAATPGGTPVTVVLPSPTPSACQPDATFVSDVSVPDGTVFKPGDPIVKTWRVRNSGSCAWEAGAQAVFVDGAQMGAAKSVAVAPTAPNATADVTVRMTAPATPGDYTAKWKLTTVNGVIFGQTLTVIVKVAGLATPTSAPTATPNPTPGAAAISFVADRTTIPYGDCVTLTWDVKNVQAVKLDGKGVTGEGGVRRECLTETKEYTLEVSVAGAADPIERTITVTVSPYVRASGAVVNLGQAVDLKTALTAGNVDILWDTTKTLQPKNGASFAVIGVKNVLSDVQQADCLNATNYAATNLSGNSVSAGTVICLKTGSGRNGKMRINNIDPTTGALTLQWVVW